MNIEFHYWVTGIIAKHAGFSDGDVEIIATSSQYVDDNDRHYEVFDKAGDDAPSYTSHVSQTMDIFKPQRELMRIYPIFHFIPGDQGTADQRTDGKSHPLRTTPNSSFAQKIMQYSLQNAASKRLADDRSGLYRLGIATHAFADTWAHQNFVGWYSDINSLGRELLPDIGHADAMHHPDMVSHRWTDARLISSEVNNNLRFLAASRKIYQSYRNFWGLVGETRDDREKELLDLLNDIFGLTYSGDREQNVDERIKKYKKAVPSLPKYDANHWVNKAFEAQQNYEVDDKITEKYVWKSPRQKAETDWYKFQEAIKDHLLCSTKILEPAFRAAGVDV